MESISEKITREERKRAEQVWAQLPDERGIQSSEGRMLSTVVWRPIYVCPVSLLRAEIKSLWYFYNLSTVPLFLPVRQTASWDSHYESWAVYHEHWTSKNGTTRLLRNVFLSWKGGKDFYKELHIQEQKKDEELQVAYRKLWKMSEVPVREKDA